MDASNPTYSEIVKLTNWQDVLPLKFFFEAKVQDITAKWHELNNCCICYCPIFDDLSIPEEEEITSATTDEEKK